MAKNEIISVARSASPDESPPTRLLALRFNVGLRSSNQGTADFTVFGNVRRLSNHIRNRPRLHSKLSLDIEPDAARHRHQMTVSLLAPAGLRGVPVQRRSTQKKCGETSRPIFDKARFARSFSDILNLTWNGNARIAQLIEKAVKRRSMNVVVVVSQAHSIGRDMATVGESRIVQPSN